MKSIARNYSYNLVYQIVQIIVPVILTPYIARVLGAEGSGRYSFSYSITSYFLLVAAFGFRYYAQRLVASHQGNQKQQSIDFWELVIVRLIPAGISIIAYLFLVIWGFRDDANQLLLFILTVDIIAVIFDISFFFQGNEEFGKIVIRSCVVKVASVIMIMSFVKVPADLWLYTLIMVSASMANVIALWPYVFRMITRIPLRDLHPFKHLKPATVLFLPTIAISVYTSLDKTMIGLITQSNVENGNYEYADKIVKVVMTLVTSLGAVVIPRNSKHFANGELKPIQDNTRISVSFVFCLGIPLMFGLIAISDMIVPWFLGEGYDKTAVLIKILAPLVIIIGLSNLFGIQLLIPSKQDKKFTISITLGAACNFLLNLLLIKYIGCYGAAIASVIAELIITLLMLFYVREYIQISSLIFSSWKPLISGLVMYVVCVMLKQKMQATIINTVIVSLIGALIYVMLLFVLKDAFLQRTMYLIKSKMKKGAIK